MNQLNTFRLTCPELLHTAVEHRTAFTLSRCELNIFETHEQASDVRLRFGGFTITNMLRGKKVMHLYDRQGFEYVPGETVLVPAQVEMKIDFPEAGTTSPTQCTALVVDNHYLQKQLDYINETLPRHPDLGQWQLDPSHFLLQNNEQLVAISNRLLQVLSSTDPMKDVAADLLLKELFLCLLRLQNLNALGHDLAATKASALTRFKAVLEYIRKHLSEPIRVNELCRQAAMSKSSFYRSFLHEFGISPNQLIISERIRYAKALLRHQPVSVAEAGYACGFTDPNYFIRVFKKTEGITPRQYQLVQE